MKVKWKGDDENSPATQVFYRRFPVDEPVDIADMTDEQQRKLTKHSQFSPVDEAAKALAKAPAPVRSAGADAPRVSEFAELWNKVVALETEVSALKEALGEPKPKSGKADK